MQPAEAMVIRHEYLCLMVDADGEAVCGVADTEALAERAACEALGREPVAMRRLVVPVPLGQELIVEPTEDDAAVRWYLRPIEEIPDASALFRAAVDAT